MGKSSLINTLLNRRGIAKTSGRPGKTQLINFFLINGALCFVDLPGYGFAHVPQRVHRQWQQLIYAYLSRRRNLVLCCLLLDCRRTVDALDHEVLDLLEELQRPTLLVVTKADKLSRSAAQRSLKQIRHDLELDDGDVALIPFSARTRQGRNELLLCIAQAVEAHASPG